MAISELQNIRNELARIRSGGASQSPTAVAQTDLKNSEKNTGNGFGYTLGKLWGGIVRSHEGWFDAAIAQAADVFGNDELAERVMKNDWMDYGKYDASFNPGKGWEFAGDVASGVGNMLPAIALSFVPFAGAGLSQGWFMQSASGQAVSDAVKETGELTNKEWAYGTASGLLEGAIEKVSGGIGGTKAGKVLGKQLGKSTLGKLAVSAAGEGGEEVASDILDPFLRKITGMSDTYEAPTLDELGRTFAVGATTGAVMGGASRGIQAAQAGGFNNLNAAEATQELTERQADSNVRQAEGKKVIYTQEDIARTKENLSKRLQKMDSNTRAQFLKVNANIANQFNEDGTVKTAIAPDTYNTNAYSASLQGREGSFAYKPITETSNATAQAKQVMDTLTKITDGKTNIVLTEDALTTENGGNANGLYKDGIIYLNANATDYQKALTVGVHEVIHGLEGTKEYEQLAKAITEEIKNDPDLAQQYNIDKYRAAYDAILEGEWTETTKDYQAVTEIFADFLANKVVNNEQLLRNLSVRNSNVFVRFLNWVRNSIAKLGESAEERKMRKDLQKLEKMLVGALQAGNGGISLEEVEDLARTAEKARKAQDGNIQSVKFGETVDNKSAVGYNKAQARASVSNTPYIQWKSDALAWANSKRTNIGDMNIGADSDFYYFYEAIDGYNEGKPNDYKVIAKVGQSNQQLIDELSEEVRKNNERNNESIHKRIDGYKAARNKNKSNSTAALGKSSRDGYVGELYRTESRSNGKRNNQEGGRNTSGQVVKKSANLQDIAYENIVKRGDMEKARKMVDSVAKSAGAMTFPNGEVKHYYHGTDANFTSFDMEKARDGTYGYGFYFSPMKSKASEYGKVKDVYLMTDRIATRIDHNITARQVRSFLEAYGLDLNNTILKKADSIESWVESKDDKAILLDLQRFVVESRDFNTQELLNDLMRFFGYKGIRQTNETVLWDNRLVKSADVVTYDDNGNLIPLSKRFNKNTADIRYSLPVDIETDVKKYYGSTYRWNETGYILQDGTRLDLSGRNEGSGGGYRQVDHRDIFFILEDGPYGTEAMVEFMGRGNIRVIPETPGINLQVEPNAEQYRLIQDFVERVGWKEGYFSVDIDNKNGDTIETLTYEGKPSGRKVVADLKYYFKEGKVPYKSNLSAFRYSIDVDSLGNQLTKEQQEFFKESKVRDEKGNLLVMYHGTPNAGFTKFRDGTYFTEHKWYAERYKGRSASSLSYKKTADNPDVYTVYLNIKKPFDTRNPEERRIFEEEYFGHYGMGTPLMESGLPDWLDAIDLQEFLEEMGYDYDGLILDEGSVGGYGDEVINRGLSYVVFDPSQVKNVDNKKPTSNPDIRYSLDAELDNKTTARVQTVVSDMTMAERWQKVLEDLKLGKADQWIKAQIAWTDEQAGIIAAGRNLGIVVHGEVQRARTAKASAINMLNDSQRDYSGKKRVGDSLKAIFKPIQSRGKKVAQDFNLYLLHQLNVDRMSAVERGLRDEVAPVFEEKVDKAFSLEKIQQLEKQYPEFKETAEKVWNYNQNLLQYRVDAGLITQAQADQMTKMYPHYVPAFYEHNGVGTSGAFVGQKGIAVKTGIKSAKGSTGVSDIKDVQASIAKQTVAVVRAASINKVVEKLYDGAVAKKDFTDVEEVGREKMTDPDVDYDTEIPKEDNVYFYKDGERITLAVTKYVDAGFRGLTAGAQLGDPLTTLSAKAISLFKKLVTSYNPLFAVTNTLRDAQEAVFYTKYPKRFFANYGKALVTRKSDPRLKELWEQYKAMGGTGSGYFSRETGVYDNRSKLKKGREWLGDKMQIVNEWVEQAPRFAEFVASVEAGNSLEQALYDSAEVTTNFSRGGKMAKALNRHLIPFLNPSIQGWSKMWRGWVAPMDGKSAAEIERLSKQSKGRRFLSNYGALMFKAILCGVSVGLFNDMLYRWIDDDEDYANLPLNIKENYYLIKVGKKFIKIPKGRVVALYGMVATRAVEAVNGNEEAMDAESWFKSASSMVSPLESASRSILAPFKDAKTNTTWYGGEIENASMENLAPSERYDEGTSSIAIAIGKVLNKSPKKIHYILDQYSGVLGDFILPKTTNKAEKGMFSSRFIVDPLYNNDISTKYYDYKEELTWAKNSGDTNAKLMLKYMNEVQDALSKMYQQKRDIANDKSLSHKEKSEQTEIIQGLINATLSSSVDMADEFEQLLINSGFEQAVGILGNNATYKKMDEKARNSAYNKLVDYYYNVCLSRLNNTKVDTKYTLYGAINATDIVVYLTDINNIESDTDKKGNVIQGSRKEKVQKYIQGLKLTAQQKYILSYLAGYAPTDNGKSAISKYLKNNGYTQKEINEIWN